MKNQKRNKRMSKERKYLWNMYSVYKFSIESDNLINLNLKFNIGDNNNKFIFKVAIELTRSKSNWQTSPASKTGL